LPRTQQIFSRPSTPLSSVCLKRKRRLGWIMMTIKHLLRR
jgi:hypothetical protein